MNTERLMLKGRQSELNALACELTLKINGKAGATRELLAMAGIAPPEKLKLNDALTNIEEAFKLQQELSKVRTELAQIEERLA